ncbi:hypothetical protein MHK_004422 [Candidatus Magnetomorum sp. HK-1]|nr:hypothetical protein MHK_004422 [Candidatus Magnetomorum sp. HK-1]
MNMLNVVLWHIVKILTHLFLYCNVASAAITHVYPRYLTIPIFVNSEKIVEGIDIIIEFDNTVLTVENATLKGGIIEDIGYELEVNTEIENKIILIVSADSTPTALYGNIIFITFRIIGPLGSRSTVDITSIYCNESESCGGLYMDRQVRKQFDFKIQKQSIVSSITVLNVLAGFIYPYEYNGIDILNDGKLSIQESIQALRNLMTVRYHSADYNPRDFQINLSEMLRMIQIYNLGGYHCDPEKKDGYAPVFLENNENLNCQYHDADYSHEGKQADYKIDLYELLRIIQFYNAGCIKTSEDSEDGFMPVNCDQKKRQRNSTTDEKFDATFLINYQSGNQIDVVTRVKYSGELNAIAMKSKLPEKYKFLSVSGKNKPAINPLKNATDEINFVWITPPESPFVFTFTVNATSIKSSLIRSEIIYRRLGGQQVDRVKQKRY